MITTASAPAKAILFGEHAVVYGYPAVAIPVPSLRAYTEIATISGKATIIKAPNIGLSNLQSNLPSTHPIRFAVEQFEQQYNVDVHQGLSLTLHSQIPMTSGMGSGAAISTALFKALFQHFNITYSLEELSNLVYKVEELHHGTPSGIDNTVTCFGKAVLYRKNKELQLVEFPQAFHLIIANSGTSTPTKETVSAVRRLYESDYDKTMAIFTKIESATMEGTYNLQNGNFLTAGQAMVTNHNLLKQLSVSNALLDGLVDAALSSGAFGAKLSGGGRGGIVIALVSSSKIEPVTEALIRAGAVHCYYSRISEI